MLVENEEDNKRGKVTNEEIFVRIGKKKIFVNRTLSTKVNWIEHVLKRICLPHDDIERQIMEVKGLGRSRRRTQHLDDLRNRRRY